MRTPRSSHAPSRPAKAGFSTRALSFASTLGLLLGLGNPLVPAYSQASQPLPALANTTPATPKPASPAVKPAAPSIRTASKNSRPLWKELTPAQQQALAPLVTEWDKLDRSRKLKWIEIAALFPRMKPEEQARSQERMREWTRLSPEARRVARDSYMRVQTLPPEKRAELLQSYQQLPDEKKRQLAAEAKAQKTLTPPKSMSRQPPAQPTPNKAQIRQGAKAGNPAAVRPPAVAPAASTANPATATPQAAPSPATEGGNRQ